MYTYSYMIWWKCIVMVKELFFLCQIELFLYIRRQIAAILRYSIPLWSFHSSLSNWCRSHLVNQLDNITSREEKFRLRRNWFVRWNSLRQQFSLITQRQTLLWSLTGVLVVRKELTYGCHEQTTFPFPIIMYNLYRFRIMSYFQNYCLEYLAYL